MTVVDSGEAARYGDKNGKPTVEVLDKGYVRLTDSMGNDLSVVNAARVSFEKESLEFADNDQGLLNFLLREGHTSPLRHGVLSFECYAPLMVARQWYKYAVASSHLDDQNAWNESSRRYVTENEEFYVPFAWRMAAASKKQGSAGRANPIVEEEAWLRLDKIVDMGLDNYKWALDAGLAPEQARILLGAAYGMYVRWRWVCSLQVVTHFLNQRLEHDAQYEIQQYAQAVKQLTQLRFPRTLEAWTKQNA